jgi:hypothetical protein
VGKKDKKNTDVWLCGGDQLCSHCEKPLKEQVRYLWWVNEFTGQKLELQTTPHWCSVCQRVHIMKGQNKKRIGQHRYVVPVKTSERHATDISEIASFESANRSIRAPGPVQNPIPESNESLESQLIKHSELFKHSISRENSKTLISRKERNLLIHSQIVIQDYPWLHKFLMRHERVHQSDINSLPHQHRTFIRDMTGDLL